MLLVAARLLRAISVALRLVLYCCAQAGTASTVLVETLEISGFQTVEGALLRHQGRYRSVRMYTTPPKVDVALSAG